MPLAHGKVGGTVQESVAAMECLLFRGVPHVRSIFLRGRSLLKMLHLNDNWTEKVFVSSIVTLSKILCPVDFPCGVHGQWPPAAPVEFLPASTDIVPVVALPGPAPSHDPSLHVSQSASSSGHGAP